MEQKSQGSSFIVMNIAELSCFPLGIKAKTLALKISLNDRQHSWFHDVLATGLTAVDDRVRDSEIKSKAIPRLRDNKEKFLKTIEYLNENRYCFVVDTTKADHITTANIIVGNYIGTEIAWLSCDVSSLLTERAFEDESSSTKPTLTPEERQMINVKYGTYLEPGKSYRHEDISVAHFLVEYNLEHY